MDYCANSLRTFVFIEDEMEGSGEIEKHLEADRIPKQPVVLPENFQWDELDLLNLTEMNELYDLLSNNYVEDGDSLFRFNYPSEFLQWALCSPGWKKTWHLGIRTKDGLLIAFIAAIPVTLSVQGVVKEMAEVNFLCVHKSFRSMRLSPLLIQEITRRVHLYGNLFQAVYTAGVKITPPVSVGQ